MTTPAKKLHIVQSESKNETCPDHGIFESKHFLGKFWSKCPACGEAEKMARDEIEKTEQRRKEQKKISDSEIPERFRDRTLQSYIAKNHGQEKALEFATDYAQNFEAVMKSGRSAIFCGKPGTGKTHLAVGIGLSIIDRHSVGFITVQRMVRRVKDAWRKDSELSESEVINMLVWPSLLIIDEIGVQFGTEFEKNLMFDILNERYEKRRPTILISNLPAAEVKAFLGERVYDRLREDGGQCVPFDWVSHRGHNFL